MPELAPPNAGSPAALKASIGTDVVTLRIGGGADELQRAQAAVRRMEGIDDVRIVDDAIIVYVRDGSAAIGKLVLLLDEASLRAREVTLKQPTLDDVFLQKTGHHLEADGAPPAEQPGAKRKAN